jgi:hypothetical protein
MPFSRPGLLTAGGEFGDDRRDERRRRAQTHIDVERERVGGSGQKEYQERESESGHRGLQRQGFSFRTKSGPPGADFLRLNLPVDVTDGERNPGETRARETLTNYLPPTHVKEVKDYARK